MPHGYIINIKRIFKDFIYLIFIVIMIQWRNMRRNIYFFSNFDINEKKLNLTVVDTVALTLICIFWTSIYGHPTARPPTEDSTEGQTTVVMSPTQIYNTFIILVNHIYP